MKDKVLYLERIGPEIYRFAWNYDENILKIIKANNKGPILSKYKTLSFI